MLQIGDHIENGRCLLLNKAYTPILRGSTPFAKSTILMKNHEGKSSVKRVIYKYISILDYLEVIKISSIGEIKLNLFIEFV